MKSYFNKIIILIFTLFILGGIDGIQARDAKGRFVVVIDAGHGGKDSGAVGKKSKEKNIVLDVALKTGAKIKALNPNIIIHYTRDKDVFIGLKERTNFANKKNADLFVSIHANSVDNRSPKGAETYVLGISRSKENLKVAMKENSAILYEDDHSVKYEGFDPNSAESYIIFQFMQNKHLDASIKLADIVQKGLVSCGLYNRGVKQDVFLVLREAAMPSILVEIGFISNPDDERFMMSANGKEQLSNKIADAVIQYEKSLSQKSGQGTTQVSSQKSTKNNSSSTNSEDTIFYRIQVLADKNEVPANAKQFKGYKEHVSYYKENGYYKYTIYNTTNLEEAKKYQAELRNRFKDCFIVGFNSSGEKIGSYY